MPVLGTRGHDGRENFRFGDCLCREHPAVIGEEGKEKGGDGDETDCMAMVTVDGLCGLVTGIRNEERRKG